MPFNRKGLLKIAASALMLVPLCPAMAKEMSEVDCQLALLGPDAPLGIEGKTYPAAVASWTPFLSRMDKLFDRIDDIVIDAERGTNQLIACRAAIKSASGEDLVSEKQQAAWAALLREKAALYVSAAMPRLERRINTTSSNSNVLRSHYYESSYVMAALEKARPDLARHIEETLRADKQYGYLVTQHDARLHKDGELTRTDRIAAALPAVIGLWKKNKGFEYSRRLPNGIEISLSCTASKGIVVTMISPEAKPFAGYSSFKSGLNWRPLFVTTASGERLYRASLMENPGGLGKSFYSNVAFFAIDVPEKRGEELGDKMAQSVETGANAMESIIGLSLPHDDGSLAQLYRDIGNLRQKSLAADTLYFGDIREVRNLASVRLAIGSDTLGRIELFDLEPAKPPFRTLMEACGN